MTNFTKAHWSTDSDSVHMSFEFSKINKEKRLVSGWATLDNVDTEGDVVLADASVRAFERGRGNLREMHEKKAVGRIVSFKEDTFRAPDGQKYRGVFVTAYVSKGAQDTWEKVLDKTLTGFSIGGNIIDFSEDFNKDGSEKIRIIKDYDLTELSLVDNPGNQYANVFSIQKSADGSVTSVTGMVADTDVLNVFYCETDKITQEKTDDAYLCPICTTKMKNIGWIEDDTDRDKKVNQIVTKFLAADSEGGVDVANKFSKVIDSSVINEDEDESVATGHEAGDPTEVPTPAVPADKPEEVKEVETPDEPAPVEEVKDEEEEISKKIDSLKDDISEILKRSDQKTSEKIDALKKSLEETHNFFETKISEFEGKFSELDTSLETHKSRLASFEKKLEKANSEGAFKKSADVDDSVVTEQNDDSDWNGAFSVKNLLR